MIQTFFRILMITMLLINVPVHAAEKLILDEQHSYVLWKIGHLGFSIQSGKWYVNGFVILDKEKPQNSKVEVSIDLSKIITGIPDLDNHLKGSLFFDVKKYPKASFISDKIEVLSQSSAKVTGVLNLHGVSKPVTLMVKLNKAGKNPINDKMTVGFTATTEFKRSDFGINTLLPDLNDKVDIEIGAEAYQSKS
ncbi:MAG: YceI family protein [Legionellales bacterium]